MNTQIISPENIKLVKDIEGFLSEKVRSIIIKDQSQYDGATALIKELKTKKSNLVKTHAIEKEPYLTNGRIVDDTFKPTIKLLDEKIRDIEKAGADYREQVRIAEEAEQRRLQEIADKERARIEAQAKANEEKARQKQLEQERAERKAQEAKDEEERARFEREAEKKRREAGKYQVKAEIQNDIAMNTVSPVIQSSIPKNERGAFNTRVYYGARITDTRKLLIAIAENGWFDLVTIKQGALDKKAGPGKSTIPGVEFYRK